MFSSAVKAFVKVTIGSMVVSTHTKVIPLLMVLPIRTLLSTLIVALEITRALKLVGTMLMILGSLTFLDLLAMLERFVISKMFPILGSSF
jgi:hypothetical protein